MLLPVVSSTEEAHTKQAAANRPDPSVGRLLLVIARCQMLSVLGLMINPGLLLPCWYQEVRFALHTCQTRRTTTSQTRLCHPAQTTAWSECHTAAGARHTKTHNLTEQPPLRHHRRAIA